MASIAIFHDCKPFFMKPNTINANTNHTHETHTLYLNLKMISQIISSRMLVDGGAFSTYNVAVGSYKLGKSPYLRGRNVFLTSSSRPQTTGCLRVTSVNTMITGELNDKLEEPTKYEPTLADRLRLGGLTEDGLSYKEKFIIRCHDVGINKTATIESIANLMQETGSNHAQNLGYSTDGFSTTFNMRKLNLIWVTVRMHIEINNYPAWGNVVEIETWAQSEGRNGMRRDWTIKDYATDQIIGRATSKWVMMNQCTRRLHKVTDDIRDEFMIYCPKLPRLAFPEEINDSLKKIAKLDDPPLFSKLGLVPRRADLDMNQHVNNVTYIGWILESMPSEIIDNHELESITLDFRRECQQDDTVDSLTSPESTVNEAAIEIKGTNRYLRINGNDETFLHLLRLAKDGSEINRGRTKWRKKRATI